MFCPLCHGQIFPDRKEFVCPHCFLQMRVHRLKRLTVFVLADNRLAGIFNAQYQRSVSFMKFIEQAPIEQDPEVRRRATVRHKIQRALVQINTTISALSEDRRGLIDYERVIERVLIHACGQQQQLSICRAQLAEVATFMEQLQVTYRQLRNDLKAATDSPPKNIVAFRQQIRQRVQQLKELEQKKTLALRGLH